MKKLLPLAVVLLACSSQNTADLHSTEPTSESASQNQPITFQSVEVYLSRGQLFADPEFEQYSLVEGRLFKECGTIRRGRHAPEQQNFEPITTEARSEIEQAASEVIPLEDEKGRFKIEKPGKGNKFYGGGEAVFTIRSSSGTAHFETSLDAISDPTNLLEKRLGRLIKKLRGAAGPMCGNNNFFGIASEA